MAMKGLLALMLVVFGVLVESHHLDLLKNQQTGSSNNEHNSNGKQSPKNTIGVSSQHTSQQQPSITSGNPWSQPENTHQIDIQKLLRQSGKQVNKQINIRSSSGNGNSRQMDKFRSNLEHSNAKQGIPQMRSTSGSSMAQQSGGNQISQQQFGSSSGSLMSQQLQGNEVNQQQLGSGNDPLMLQQSQGKQVNQPQFQSTFGSFTSQQSQGNQLIQPQFGLPPGSLISQQTHRNPGLQAQFVSTSGQEQGNQVNQPQFGSAQPQMSQVNRLQLGTSSGSIMSQSSQGNQFNKQNQGTSSGNSGIQTNQPTNHVQRHIMLNNNQNQFQMRNANLVQKRPQFRFPNQNTNQGQLMTSGQTKINNQKLGLMKQSFLRNLINRKNQNTSFRNINHNNVNKGNSNLMNNNQGTGNQGRRNLMNGNHGNENQGKGNLINGNHGNGNQGSRNLMNGNHGNGNQGSRNLMNGNHGNENQGKGNLINGNHGNGNQGSRNLMNGNHGNGNQGNLNQANGNQVNGNKDNKAKSKSPTTAQIRVSIKRKKKVTPPAPSPVRYIIPNKQIMNTRNSVIGPNLRNQRFLQQSGRPVLKTFSGESQPAVLANAMQVFNNANNNKHPVVKLPSPDISSMLTGGSSKTKSNVLLADALKSLPKDILRGQTTNGIGISSGQTTSGIGMSFVQTAGGTGVSSTNKNGNTKTVNVGRGSVTGGLSNSVKIITKSSSGTTASISPSELLTTGTGKTTGMSSSSNEQNKMSLTLLPSHPGARPIIIKSSGNVLVSQYKDAQGQTQYVIKTQPKQSLTTSTVIPFTGDMEYEAEDLTSTTPISTTAML